MDPTFCQNDIISLGRFRMALYFMGPSAFNTTSTSEKIESSYTNRKREIQNE
ncbi:UNVERIFIED_CONTAM: hypothetical protein FKN15_014843 [Acipenser sinensis]